MATEKPKSKDKAPKEKAADAPKADAPKADAPKADAPAKDKTEAPAEAKADPSKNYSRGEGQKAVTQAYKDNWNAIFGEKKKKKR
jgi:hypothetical protein